MISNFSEFRKNLKAGHLSEATYRTRNIAPLLKKLGILFGKQFGSAFKSLPPEKFKRTDGMSGVGYRMLNSQGIQLRINFKSLGNALDGIDKDTMYISGIDYWAADNDNFNRATLNVTFSRDTNILQIYKQLLGLIKSGRKGKYTATDVGGNLKEATELQKRRSDFLKSKGLTQTMAYKSKDVFDKYLKQNGKLDEWYVLIESGAPEKNTTAQGLEQAQKQFDDTKYSDPKTIFKDIEKLVRLLLNAESARSLIICGQAGVGKTYHVTKMLKEFGVQGKDYTYHGAMNVSPNSFFSTIAQERNKIICFDEADAILKDKDIQVMLKPLLDTSGDHRCEWSIQTAPMSARKEEEVRNYTDNVFKAASNGDIELVFSRKATRLEVNPQMYKKDGIYSILSKKTELANAEESVLRSILAEILPDSDDFKIDLADFLSKKNKITNGLTDEAKEEILFALGKAFDTLLETPNKVINPTESTELPQVRYPSTIFFDGKMIFISNMRAEEIEPAVLSRSIFVDVYLRSIDVRNRILDILSVDPSYEDIREQLLKHIENMTPSAEIENQTKVATYTNDSLRKNGKQLSIRYIKLAADMIRSGVDDWEELASKYC